MTRSKGAARRTGPQSDASNGPLQKSTNSEEPSSSLIPMETQGRANDAFSSVTTAKSNTVLAGTSRKRPRAELKEDGEPSRRLKKCHRQLHNEQPAPTSNCLYDPPQRAGFLCLPLELKQQILSYGSARDTARFRRVCRSTNELVVGSMRYLVKLYAGRELSRLREVVNEFTDLKTPSDIDSLMEALHVWTKRRGHFADGIAAASSAFKMMAHFLVKQKRHFKYTAKRPSSLDPNRGMWALIAGHVARMLSCPLTGWELDAHMTELASTGLLDPEDLDKLSGYVKDPQSQPAHHRLGGQLWPEEKLEFMTFPGLWKLTPLLQHPSTYNVEEPGPTTADLLLMWTP